LPTIEEDLVFDSPLLPIELEEVERRRNIKVALAANIALQQRKRKKAPDRRAKKSRERRDPNQLLQQSTNDGLFRREYRMTENSFFKLDFLLRDDLKPSPRNKRDDIILNGTKLMIALRFFAGASYLDLIRIHGVSKPAVFKSIREVVKAINKHPDVGKAKFPVDECDCASVAAKWAVLSGQGTSRCVLSHCVGALDGLLIRTRAPTTTETLRVRDFYSGHKKAIGLNLQGVCDADLRLIFVCTKCPGKTNDLRAYETSSLQQLVESLPEGYYLVGDNAYMNSNHLLVPYPGRHNLGSKEDTFNFYLSQLRVRVENCFAQLVGRWGIFWRPLRVPL
jgi:hypothetical protein